MADECNWCFGVGITENELKPGTVVAVAVNRASTGAYGPAIICLARVLGPTSRDGWYWLDVFTSPHFGPQSQQFHMKEILGVPGLGVTIPQLALTPTGAHQIDPTVALSRFANHDANPVDPPTSAPATVDDNVRRRC